MGISDVTDLYLSEGHPALSAYSAAKFAVRGLTQSAGTTLEFVVLLLPEVFMVW